MVCRCMIMQAREYGMALIEDGGASLEGDLVNAWSRRKYGVLLSHLSWKKLTSTDRKHCGS